MFRERVRIKSHVSGESRTQQSHKETVDINNIIRKFDRTGVLPPAIHQPMYGDVTSLNRPYAEIVEDAQVQIAEAEAFIVGKREEIEAAKKTQKEEEAALIAEAKAARAKAEAEKKATHSTTNQPKT